MMNSGLLDEVKKLNELNFPKDCNSRQGIGYKEMFDHIDGKISLEQAVEDIKKHTRHFAKRQLTWLRHEDDTIFINKSEFDHDNDKILEYMTECINKSV